MVTARNLKLFLLAVGILCGITQNSLAVRYGAAPVVDIPIGTTSKPKKIEQKVLLTIEMKPCYGNTASFANLRTRETHNSDSPDGTIWAIYKYNQDGKDLYFHCKRNICATDDNLGYAQCYVDPKSGNVLSPVIDSQKNSFLKMEYVGYVNPFSQQRDSQWRLDISSGPFSSYQLALLSLDTEYKGIAPAPSIEYAALVLSGNGGFRKTTNVPGNEKEVTTTVKNLYFFNLDNGVELDPVAKFYPVSNGESTYSEYCNVGRFSLVAHWHSHPSQDGIGCLFSATDRDGMDIAGVPSAVSDSGELCLMNPDEQKVYTVSANGGEVSLNEKLYESGMYPAEAQKNAPIDEKSKGDSQTKESSPSGGNYYLPETEDFNAVKQKQRSPAQVFSNGQWNESSRKVFGNGK